MNDPLVSILIPNWNSKKYIDRCIMSLLDQTWPNREIILIDNASTDGSVQLAKERFRFVKVIQNVTNLGFAGAINVGIKEARGDLIALFNQDAFAHKDWLRILVEAVERSSNIAAAAGKIFYWREGGEKDAVFCTWPRVDPYTASVYNFSDNEPMSTVDYLSGAAMIVKRNIIQEVGLLDTQYFLYFDETDWCARMIRAGYGLLYIPEAKAWHAVSASVSDAGLKSFYMIRNQIRFVLKNFDLKYIFAFVLFLLVDSTMSFMGNVRRSDLRETKLRLRAICWNILNLKSTLKARRRDLRMIVEARGRASSYNESLPLREYKI